MLQRGRSTRCVPDLAIRVIQNCSQMRSHLLCGIGLTLVCELFQIRRLVRNDISFSSLLGIFQVQYQENLGKERK